MWLFKETLTIAFHEEPIAQYEVVPTPDDAEWQQVSELRAIPSRYPLPHLPLWESQSVERYKVKQLHPYAPRRSIRVHGFVQERLFA